MTHSFLFFRHHCYTFFLNLKEENYPPQFYPSFVFIVKVEIVNLHPVYKTLKQ